MSYSDAYDPNDGVAIVGLAGRFPGARDVDEFWENLVDGPRDDLALRRRRARARGARRRWRRAAARTTCARAGSSRTSRCSTRRSSASRRREAEVIDPQQRVFLEAAWEALERAGYDPRDLRRGDRRVRGDEQQLLLPRRTSCRATDVTDIVGWLTTMMGNEKDYLATRVSYKLDLRGPGPQHPDRVLDVARRGRAPAVQSLLNYQCDMALAGGVSITLPQKRGYLYQEGGITSPDGHCRAFDEHAAGTVFSNGVGIVVLRRLERRARGRRHDLRRDQGRGDQQRRLREGQLHRAERRRPRRRHRDGAGARRDRSRDDLVRRGARDGTPLGDPDRDRGPDPGVPRGRRDRNGFCAIGSVKSNIGHLDAAAGVAGLIKTALALHHKTLPPSLHFNAPNPKLDLESTPFVVNSPATVAVRQRVRRAAPASARSASAGRTPTSCSRRRLSPARPGADERRAAARALGPVGSGARRGHVEPARPSRRASRTDPLADVAFTLQDGPAAVRPSPRAVVAAEPTTRSSGSARWTRHGASRAPARSTKRRSRSCSRDRGRSPWAWRAALYDAEPVFRAEVDECAAVLRPQLGFDLRDVLYPEPGGEELAEQRLAQTAVTQPALFVIEYALAHGVAPLGRRARRR